MNGPTTYAAAALDKAADALAQHQGLRVATATQQEEARVAVMAFLHAVYADPAWPADEQFAARDILRSIDEDVDEASDIG